MCKRRDPYRKTIGGRPVEVRWWWMCSGGEKKTGGCVEFHAGSGRQRQRTTFLNEARTYEKV